MSSVGVLLAYLLSLVQLLVLARVAVDWLGMLATGPSAGRWLNGPTALVHRLSEPLLAPVRRVLPNPRLGSVRLDLSPVVLLIGVAVLRGLVLSL
jgi:YggT family protein